jgi:hypothetical protein
MAVTLKMQPQQSLWRETLPGVLLTFVCGSAMWALFLSVPGSVQRFENAPTLQTTARVTNVVYGVNADGTSVREIVINVNGRRARATTTLEVQPGENVSLTYQMRPDGINVTQISPAVSASR